MGTQRQPQFRWHEGGEQAYHRAIRAWKTKVAVVSVLTVVAGIAFVWSWVTYGFF